MRDSVAEHEFLYAFGHFIMTWNHVENYARDILFTLAGQSIYSSLMTKHLGNGSVTDILVTAAAWKPDAAEHFKHFASLMDTLRSYRNYYVHCMIGTGSNEEVGAFGIIFTIEARKKYRLSEKVLKLAELEELLSHCIDTREYAKDIKSILANGVRAERIVSFAALKKPKMPKPLAKKYRDNSATVFAD